VTNTLRRTLESLGLQRRSRDVTPSLTEYLSRKSNEGLRNECLSHQK
jgi:hypothetical protein